MIVSPARSTLRYSYIVQFAVLFPVLLFAFIAYLAVVNGSNDPSNPAVLSALGTCTLVCVVLFVYLRKNVVSIHDEGLIQRRLFLAEKQIEWKDVSETRYRQTALAQDLMLHFGLLGALISPFVGKGESSKKGTQELKIVGKNKTSITLSNYFVNVREAIRTTLDRVNPVIMEQTRSQLRQGKEVRFGDLVIASSGVTFKKKRLAYSEMESVKVSGREFRVKQTGKWLDAVVVPSQKIPNIFVAIDLIEELRQGIAVTDSSRSSMAATV